MAFLNLTGASAAERAALMCMERVEALERRLEASERRQAALRGVLFACLPPVFGTDRHHVYADLFTFLLGVDAVAIRSSVASTMSATDRARHIFRTLPPGEPSPRVLQLHALLRSDMPPCWADEDTYVACCVQRFTLDDTCPIDDVLQHMTPEELEGFWRYRKVWAGWASE
jgi:hypothetical protein